MEENEGLSRRSYNKGRNWIRSLGPGLITGASDDDPSGIATYSQAGAQTGFQTLWVMLFAYPMMATIQLVSAEIGRVTGSGLAGNMKKYYSRWIMGTIVSLMVMANIVNIGADIAAMGEAVHLVSGGHAVIFSIVLTLLSLILQIFIPYRRYVFFLKWLTLVLFSYVAVIFCINVPWLEVIKHLVIPTFGSDKTFFLAMIALLGTTISPYLFFWQASEEVEEEEGNPDEQPLLESPEQAVGAFARIKTDTLIGIGFSNAVAIFIIISAAVTLHNSGNTNIQSAAQAAEALRPIAGEFAFILFAIGIIGTGMLALPVLAGSAAYAIGEVFSLTIGLEKKPRQAKGFYSLIAGITLAGMLLIFIGVNPIQALYWAAVVNGIVAVPIMLIMMLMASNKKVMGQFTLKPITKIIGWASTIIMLGAATGLFLTL